MLSIMSARLEAELSHHRKCIGRRKKADQRPSGVLLRARADNPSRKSGVVLNGRGKRSNKFDSGIAQDFVDHIETDLSLAIDHRV